MLGAARLSAGGRGCGAGHAHDGARGSASGAREVSHFSEALHAELATTEPAASPIPTIVDT